MARPNLQAQRDATKDSGTARSLGSDQEDTPSLRARAQKREADHLHRQLIHGLGFMARPTECDELHVTERIHLTEETLDSLLNPVNRGRF